MGASVSVLLHGIVTTPTSGWDLTVQLAGSPARAVTVTAADRLFGDLVAALQTAVRASGAEHAAFVADISGDMVVLTGAGPGNTTITWTDTDLRDHLGYTGATTTLTGSTPLAATLPPSAYLPLAYEAISDVPRDENLRSVAVSDTTLYAVSYGYKTFILPTVRFTGAPRAAVVDEYLRMRRWFKYVVGPGKSFRYYPRVSVTTAYAAITNPYGYTCHRWESPRDFAPDLVTPGWYSQWAISCRWHPAAAV